MSSLFPGDQNPSLIHLTPDIFIHGKRARPDEIYPFYIIIIIAQIIQSASNGTKEREDYRPGSWPLCIMAAFCSWKRSPRRAELLRNLSTQRSTQPSSRATRDLVVKSLTQSSKQRWTSLEYICGAESAVVFFLWSSGHVGCAG